METNIQEMAQKVEETEVKMPDPLSVKLSDPQKSRIWGFSSFSFKAFLMLMFFFVCFVAMYGIAENMRLGEIEWRTKKADAAYNRFILEQNRKIDKVAAVIVHFQPRLDPDIAKLIAKCMVMESKRCGVNLSLMLGVCFVESNFNPLAVSPMNASGLMQVRYSVWREESELKDNGVKKEFHLFWVDANIRGGTAILKKFLLKEKGDLPAALYRYNTGGNIKDAKKYDGSYTNAVIQTAYQSAILLGAD